MTDSAAFFLTFALALSVSLALVPVADWLGRRFRIVTKLGGRRTNEVDARGVSRLGGVAVFGGFVTAVIAAQWLPVPRLDPYEVIRLIGLLGGLAIVFVTGLLDDWLDLPPLPQLIGQSLAAAVAILFQIFIEYFNNPLTGEQTAPWAFIVTVTISYFWLVGMMNTVNFLDGADGLSSGVAVIAGVLLFLNSAYRVEPAQISVSLLHLALIGAVLGFLIHNSYPARIVLGGGAPMLGFLLGALAIIGGAKMATILLVMGLPLADGIWQATRRILRGRNPMSGDRGHLHFRLLDMGISQQQLVIGYYAFCAVFGGVALLADSRLFKFIALGVMALCVVIGFAWIERRAGQSLSERDSVASSEDNSVAVSSVSVSDEAAS